MRNSPPRILIYGYGNPGRQDDALGILVSEEIGNWVEKNNIKNIDVDQNYQLNIEDAEKISHYDLVIFADASVNETQTFSYEPLKPDLKTDFTMHSVKPSFIVGLCQQIFGKNPQAYILQIRGYKWELVEKTTRKAKKNLYASVDFLKTMIKEKYLL
jgi:hydrogenase maturation protease